MSNETPAPDKMPTSDSLATKLFWIIVVGAALFCGVIFLFVLRGTP